MSNALERMDELVRKLEWLQRGFAKEDINQTEGNPRIAIGGWLGDDLHTLMDWLDGTMRRYPWLELNDVRGTCWSIVEKLSTWYKLGTMPDYAELAGAAYGAWVDAADAAEYARGLHEAWAIPEEEADAEYELAGVAWCGGS